MPRSLDFEYLLTASGLRRHQRVVVDDDGVITAIEDAPGERWDGFLALPGMPNGHSHAFQRAMAGLGEAATGDDSFWSWREAMYRLSAAVGPDELYATARRAFSDMLAAGFTAVGEFHYLHHLPDGSRGPQMGTAVIEAARDCGIRMVLLPVYYRCGGFSRPASPGQRRFVHESAQAFCELLASLPDVALGVAPHSLRAVPAAEIPALLEQASQVLGDEFPLHIHISEQTLEVRDCLADSGRTPVALLDEAVALGPRWSLVHATHATAWELDRIASAGARVVLCPMTEAYLGDGIFPAQKFRSFGGAMAIGSDSNARIDAVEELRWLEYGQRLQHERRACLADDSGIGRPLWADCAAAGAESLGLAAGRIEPGRLADLVVLGRDASPLGGVDPPHVLDAWLTGGSREHVEQVYVGGEARLSGGLVRDEEQVARAYADCMQTLGARIRDGARS